MAEGEPARLGSAEMSWRERVRVQVAKSWQTEIILAWICGRKGGLE